MESLSLNGKRQKSNKIRRKCILIYFSSNTEANHIYSSLSFREFSISHQLDGIIHREFGWYKNYSQRDTLDTEPEYVFRFYFNSSCVRYMCHLSATSLLTQNVIYAILHANNIIIYSEFRILNEMRKKANGFRTVRSFAPKNYFIYLCDTDGEAGVCVCVRPPPADTSD